jgi:hypothetical protein
MLVRYNSTFANFWGATGEKGFYERSDDYLDIVNGERK